MVRDRVDHEAPVTRQRMTPCANPTEKINLIPYNEILKNGVANDIRQSISSGTPEFLSVWLCAAAFRGPLARQTPPDFSIASRGVFFWI
ncbi:hypothetical protein [Burkholderia sola]|uniref:hypothetical protein n=1 Tax=Burkholderia sola TaxID=2843302 RepID=UPI001C0A8D96